MSTPCRVIVKASFLLVLASCSLFKDDGPGPCEPIDYSRFSKDTTQVIGTWDWVYLNRVSLKDGCIKETVRDGYPIKTWIFEADGTATRYQDGELFEQVRYRFDWSHLDETGLSIYIGHGEGGPCKFGVGRDTLIVDHSPVDGNQEIFIRRR